LTSGDLNFLVLVHIDYTMLLLAFERPVGITFLRSSCDILCHYIYNMLTADLFNVHRYNTRENNGPRAVACH